MSVIKTIWKGVGTTFIKGANRVLKFSHDDAGWFEFGGKRVLVLAVAITTGVTATTMPEGSFATTTHATGKNQIFRSNGTHWILMLSSSSKMAGHTVLGAVATATVTAGATQLDLLAVAEPSNMASIVQPKTPRNVVINFTDGDASISAFDVTVHGKAPDGTTISENFVFAGGLDQVGSKIFASITNFTLNSIAGNAAADTLDVGYGAKLGLPVPYGATGLVITKLISDGTVEAASATDQTNNSFTPTTAPNGAKIFEVWFGYGFPA